MFGPREVLLTSDEPVVRQFLNGSRIGPIGMSEEKDQATMAAERAQVAAGHHDGGTEDVRGVVPQIEPTPGLPERAAVRRRKDRVMSIIDTLPAGARRGIENSLTAQDRARYGIGRPGGRDQGVRAGDTATEPVSRWRAAPGGGA